MRRQAIFTVHEPDVRLEAQRVSPAEEAVRFSLTEADPNIAGFMLHHQAGDWLITAWTTKRKAPKHQVTPPSAEEGVLAVLNRPSLHALMYAGGRFFYRRHRLPDEPLALSHEEVAELLRRCKLECLGRVSSRGERFIRRWSAGP